MHSKYSIGSHLTRTHVNYLRTSVILHDNKWTILLSDSLMNPCSIHCCSFSLDFCSFPSPVMKTNFTVYSCSTLFAFSCYSYCDWFFDQSPPVGLSYFINLKDPTIFSFLYLHLYLLPFSSQYLSVVITEP